MNARTTLISLLVLLLGTAAGANASERPNIVLIMVDDMGFSDIAPYGGEIETPNLDLLAQGGIKLSNFYNSGRCCPTRASLMTGLHPHQTGIGWMTNPTDSVDHTHGPNFPSYQGNLNRNCLTIAEVLQSFGYATLMSGKWHLGPNEKDDHPLNRGFERFYGYLTGAGNFFNPTYPSQVFDGYEPVEKHQSTTDRHYYTTDAFTDHAIDFMHEEGAAKDRPFFLYLAYTAPHWPLQAHQEEIDKYVGKYAMGWDQIREQRLKRQRTSGLINPDWKLAARSSKAWDEIDAEKQKDMDLRMAMYAAMIDRVDQNIGNLIQSLKASGKFDNTLILFLSDNGACQEGGKLGGKSSPYDSEKWNASSFLDASYGEVWANASNTPFRKFKHFTHEGGIATPFIAYWPKGISPQTEWYRETAYLPDVAATLYEIAEATYPTESNGKSIPPLPGISLTPAFKAEPLERDSPLYFEHEDNAAIIDGRYKLVGSSISVPAGIDYQKWELYDLIEDRTETNNLAAKFPKIVEALARKWDLWAKEIQIYPKPLKRSNKLPKKQHR